MAESEIYRVEIPIIVDDQSEAPIERARERVTRFEKEARKRNEMIRKHFETIAKMQIEPVMRIKDQLTASVIKADRLIKRLGMEQASPIIAAQDRVSAVVTRINAVLDALDKGKVDVIADMKGPLMDEIVKARAALSALNGVKAGPVADLRGELFGQLAKAMSQLRGLDKFEARPEATLKEKVLWKARAIAVTLRGITSRVWTVTLRAKDMVTGAAQKIFRAITSPLGLIGVGLGGAAAFQGIVKAPLELAGNMEQARIGFSTLLGSEQRAATFLKELQLMAAKTPFEFPQLQESARLLLAFKWQSEDIIPTMTAIGNAAAGLGAGPEGIERIVRALGQMRAKGKVSAEEIMQLTEVGIPAYDILQKKLGLTASQMDNIGKSGIKAEVAIKALIAGMDEQFKGMMKNQSMSLLGLWSTIKDTFNMQIFYRWGEGLRQAIQPKVMRLVEWFEKNQATVERWGDILERTARDAGEAVISKFSIVFNKIRQKYLDNPEFQKLDISGKINFVMGDIGKVFSDWWDSTGKVWAFNTGKDIASELIKGFMEVIANNPLFKIIASGAAGYALFGVPGAIAGAGSAAVPMAMDKLIEMSPLPQGVKDFLKAPKYSEIEKKIKEKEERTEFYRSKNVMKNVFNADTMTVVKPYAHGGILTRPHLGMVAEAGPEAIIPLSARMRARALALYEETGRRLGVRPYEEGGFAGALTQNREQKIPVSFTPSLAMPGPATINLNFDLTGLVRQVVIERREDIDGAVDKITDAIANNLREVFQNMTK